MSIGNKLRSGKFIILLVFVSFCGLIGFFASTMVPPPILVYPYIIAIINGPNIVQSVTSPDGNFEAYVEDQPSIDPPNQSLYVQRSDMIHYMYIAHLAEDVDAIQKIHWSPYSDVVVFHTMFYLIAVRVPGYQTVKIYLGREWTRTKPSRRSTFTSGGPSLRVAAIEFPRPGTFSYRLKGSDEFHTIEMDSLVGH